ncbi:hypothetical protein QYM36_002036 [Artemia franciscana]|uniref:Uncharacterized protein n=1 Tax=Artemia franciscana TaxID=6661 RepID=A0AA88IMV7_ARTSF|nr:hypothetical protein QYM36_002036 [Artemia franciscana]
MQEQVTQTSSLEDPKSSIKLRSRERKFNNEVIDKPLDYINEAPVVGPGYNIVPERFWYEETQLNWDHCKECNFQDRQPDGFNECIRG